MSLEDSIKLLTEEIKHFKALLIENTNLYSELLQKIVTETPIRRKQHLTEAETAEYIGMSRSFLAKDRMNGHREGRLKGPNPVKIGKRAMYDIDELNEWLKVNTIER